MKIDIKQLAQMTKPLSLLYVEDNESARMQTLKIFQLLFDSIEVEVDGQEGLEAFKKQKPDLIITDLNMPNMNGLMMTEKIREIDSEIPIIILSANDEADYFIRSIRLNVNGYALKPIEMESLMMTLHKVVGQMMTERELQAKTVLMRQYQTITDQSSIVSKTDTDGKIIYVNQAFCDFTGYTQEELIGKTHNIIAHPDTPPETYQEMWQTISVKKQLFQTVLKNQNKRGESYYSKTTIMPLLNEKNEITEYIGLHTDVTDIMQPSRQFKDHVSHLDCPVVVLFRIQNYHKMEHYFGDTVAEGIEVGFYAWLQTEFQSFCALGRFFLLGAGDVAFASEQEEISQDHAAFIVQLKSLQQKIDEHIVTYKDVQYDISTLISVAYGVNPIENVYGGMEKLEMNRDIFIHAHDLNNQLKADAKQHLDMLHIAKHALYHERVFSFFQPIIDNQTGQPVKYESLVRLQDEEGRFLTPWHFMEVVKQGGLYPQMTQKVLENSFQALAMLSGDISINLSIQDIERSLHRKTIFDLLEKYRDQACRIVFELLEDETIKNFEQITSFIADVKGLGVKIAIDDFGSGYSNYQRLMQYQPDILKIDGSLIQKIDKDPYIRSVVKNIAGLAQENGIQTVAEFVENEAIHAVICDLGIDYSQGYYFGKPEKITM